MSGFVPPGRPVTPGGFVVPGRFRGPAQSGNGGWTSGHLARTFRPSPDEAVRVVLRRPPPLDRDLEISVDGETAAVIDPADGAVILRGQRLTAEDAFEASAPPAVAWDDAVAAADSYGGQVNHPFPTCFACGTDRAQGDGLRLAPGHPADEPRLTAAAWVPDPSLADPDDAAVTTAEVAWAALDCPGGWAVDLAGRPMVLGTMTAQVRRTPRIGVRHVVTGRCRWQAGRKAGTDTALYEVGDPVPLARAAAVWIAVDPASVQPGGGTAPRNAASQ